MKEEHPKLYARLERRAQAEQHRVTGGSGVGDTSNPSNKPTKGPENNLPQRRNPGQRPGFMSPERIEAIRERNPQLAERLERRAQVRQDKVTGGPEVARDHLKDHTPGEYRKDQLGDYKLGEHRKDQLGDHKPGDRRFDQLKGQARDMKPGDHIKDRQRPGEHRTDHPSEARDRRTGEHRVDHEPQDRLRAQKSGEHKADRIPKKITLNRTY